ncbi:MAG: hypothetical protein ABI726_05900, partial [bacterium]
AADAGLSGVAVREEAERVRKAHEREARRRQRGGAAARPSKRSRRRTALKLLLGVLVVGALAAGAFFGARQVYFLGSDTAGQVALYRGLPYDLPLGIELYSEVEPGSIALDTLPRTDQQTVIDHDLRSSDDARSLLDSLAAVVKKPVEENPSGGGKQNGGKRKGGQDSAGNG